MTRNEWSRWGRGACEGYGLSVCGGGNTRFEGSVSRSVPQPDGGYQWFSTINGKCEQTHATRDEALARVEHELSIAGNAFVSALAEYKTHRSKNKFSQAVDALRAAHLNTNGSA